MGNPHDDLVEDGREYIQDLDDSDDGDEYRPQDDELAKDDLRRDDVSNASDLTNDPLAIPYVPNRIDHNQRSILMGRNVDDLQPVNFLEGLTDAQVQTAAASLTVR